MPADVILSTWEVSQEPESISFMTINSSTEITCSTSLSQPLGVSLQREFHSNKRVVYLNLEDRKVTKTISAEFTGRIDITPDQQMEEGYKFTFQLSVLEQEDTDWYYCSWIYYNSKTSKKVTLPSKGTIIIVREGEPQTQCKNHIEDLVFIALSVTAFTAILFLFIGALIVRCKRFKKHFRPARPVKSPRPHRPQHVCPGQAAQHVPYLITSLHNTDFRGIL